MADAPGDGDAGAVEAAFTTLRRAENPANILALGGLLAQEQPHIRPSDFRGSLSCWNRGCRAPPGAAANKSQAVATTFTGWNGSGGDNVQPGCAGREPRFSGARGSRWTLMELSPGDSSQVHGQQRSTATASMPDHFLRLTSFGAVGSWAAWGFGCASCAVLGLRVTDSTRNGRMPTLRALICQVSRG